VGPVLRASEPDVAELETSDGNRKSEVRHTSAAADGQATWTSTSDTLDA